MALDLIPSAESRHHRWLVRMHSGNIGEIELEINEYVFRWLFI